MCSSDLIGGVVIIVYTILGGQRTIIRSDVYQYAIVIATLDIFSNKTFYSPAHQKIYAAIYKLFKDSQPIDLMTVKDQLLKDGTLKEIGGGGYLVYLTERVSSSANIEFHARILIQKYIQRRLIKMSNEIIEEAYDEETDVFDLLDSAEGKLFSITQGNITS